MIRTRRITYMAGRAYEELTEHLKKRIAELRAETHDTYEYKPTGMPLHYDFGTQSESGLVKQKK